MKHLSKYIGAALLLAGAMACEKKTDPVADFETVNGNKAYLKVIHASPFFRQAHNHQDTFNVFVNNFKVNPTPLSYGGVFPFAVNATTNSFTATYAAVEPGTGNIRLSLPGKTNQDSLTIFTLDKTMEAGKYYTFMITDSLKTNRDSAKIFTEDIFNDLPIRSGYYNFRFINAAMNDTAGKTVNVFSYARNASIFTNVRPGAITGFSQIGYNPSVVDTFYIRRYIPPPPGSSMVDTGRIFAKVVFNAAIAGSGSLEKRTYTLYYKGDANAATGTKARSVTAYIND